MSFFDNIILNSILAVLPITLYLLITIKNKELNQTKNTLLIDLACFTSIYLIFKYNLLIPDIRNLLFINIPLIILTIYKRKYSTLLASLLIILFYYKIFNIELYILVVEYMIYFILFYILKYKNKSKDFIINTFMFIKGIVLTIEFMYSFNTTTLEIFIRQFSNLVMFYLVSIIIIYCISKAEELLNYKNIIKELEKEKILKNSLFKITHEIKNPIAVCKGYLSMMNQEDTKTNQKYIEIIKSEINRTLDIMDNFSEYTKININKDEMDLCLLVEEVVDSMGILFDEKSIEVKYLGPEELYINADYNRLKQVLINILKNSSEAITTNGIIKIKISETKNEVQIDIEDNGCGISEENLNKITELFHSSKEKGCGIGVPLSLEIIKLHNGTIKYTSKENKWTNVLITIPKK